MRLPRATIYALVYTGVIALIVGFVPLFGGPGYECALAYGVLLPSAAAIASVRPERARSVARGMIEGLGTGALLFAFALFVSFLHLLHAPACEPWSGALYVCLTAGVGVLLGGLWGGVLRELGRPGLLVRRSTRVLAALSLPVGGALISVLRFYGSPMIFAFDPFVGYFSGTLYDTVVEPGSALLWYRLGSACTIVGTLALGALLVRAGERVRLRVASGLEAAVLVIGAGCVMGSVGLWLAASRIDVAHDASSIARELGGRMDGARCTVLFPRTLEPREASLLLRDCEEELLDVERVLGASGPPRLTAYFFRDAGEKKRLMGAANTYIAKPWRGEVYLQLQGYPHPVLGHEIAHVVAGTFGRGPFRIAGAFAGLLPNPGLIEGVASAASPDADVLTDLEWCRAMKDATLLPRLASLFSLSFLGQPASRAYTVAGAFVGWVHERHGSAAVRQWYAGGDLTQITGRSWEQLEADFHARLDELILSPTAAEYARAKFDRPSVFGRTCPHLVDRLRGQGEACLRDHDLEGAQRAFDDALAVDARDARSRLGLAQLQVLREDLPGALERYEAITGDPSAQVRERAREQRADLLALRGEYERASLDYETIEAESEDEDTARSAEVKRMAVRDPLLRAPVLTFLLGSAPSGQKLPLLAGALLGEARASSARSAALGSYLLGKNLVSQGAHGDALPWLRAAYEQRSELGPRTRRELDRQLAIVACVTDDAPLRERLSQALAPAGAPTDGRNLWIVRLLSRCHGP